MSSVTIEVTGEHTQVVDEATSALLDQLAEANIEVKPAQTSGERDGGIVALAIAIAGGAASIAQVASTIHAMSRKKEVQIVVIDRSGARTPINPSDESDEIQAIIEEVSAQS